MRSKMPGAVRVPQRAAGNYTPVETGSFNAPPSPTPETTSQDEGKINQLIAELRSLIATLKHLKAYVVLRDLRDAEELDRKSKQAFTKQNK